MTPGLADEPAGPERVGEEPEQVPEVEAVPDPGEAEPGTGPDPDDAPEATEEEDPLARANRERDEYLELAQRTRAEFDNYRKRVASETEAAVARGRGEVAEGVIEALDNLERVMTAEGVETSQALSEGVPEGAPVALQGVVVAYRDLVGALARAGIERFDPVGEPFDPNLHEALQAIEAGDAEAGVVVETMQNGYRAGEQVVRAARVVVSR